MKHGLLRGCLLITILTISALAGGQTAPEQPLPAAEEVLDRMVEAIGGGEAFSSITSIVSQGRMEMGKLGISGTMVLSQVRPDLSLSVVEIEGLGAIRSGTIGDVAWEKSDIQGPRLLEGGERDLALRTADIDVFVNWRSTYETVETVAREQVGEQHCIKLRLVASDGRQETWWLDEETGLLAKIALEIDSIMGKVPFESYLSDYRKVGEITVPFHTANHLVGQEILIIFDSIELNTELDPSLFTPPADVQALLDREAKSTEEPGDEPEPTEQGSVGE